MLRLLTRLLVVPFYQRHAGVLLVAFLLLFGVAGNYAVSMHLVIMQAMASTPVVMAMVAVGWTLYTLKTLQFSLLTLRLPENCFLVNFSLLPPARQWAWLWLTQAQLYAPVGAYAAVAAGVAFNQQVYGAAAFAVLFSAALCLAAAGVLRRAIARPGAEGAIGRGSQLAQRLTRRLGWQRPHLTHLATAFWAQAWYQEPTLLLTTKAISLGVLLGTFPLYASVDYDPRMLRLGFLLSTLAHTGVVARWHRFEVTELAFTRQLPVSLARRLGSCALAYAGLLVPEVLFLLRSLSGTFGAGQVAEYAAWGVATCLAGHCAWFWPRFTPDTAPQWTFAVFIASLLAVMYHVSPFALAAGWMLLAATVLKQRYYRYEGG